MTLNMVDVSSFQPSNITKLVSYDIAGVKATEGTTYVSRACDAQVQAALAAGKEVAVYHFADGGSPEAEAEWFWKNCTGYAGKVAFALDDEANAAKLGDAWSDAFVTHFRAVSGGYGEIVYASASVLKGLVKTAHDALTGWDADWGANPVEGYNPPAQVASVGPWSAPRFRQYTSNGTLAGYSGRLDLDAFYGTVADFRKLIGKGATAPAPVAFASPTPHTPVRLKVDGILGVDSITRWQQVEGTTPDGTISATGSTLVAAVEKRLNALGMRDWEGKALAVDGLGASLAQNNTKTRTIWALQNWLLPGGGKAGGGTLSTPISETVKKIQTQLNSGKF